MADSFNKKEREKKKRKRKQEKAERKKQKKLEDSTTEEFMYVDEFGNLTPEPPDPTKRKKIKAEDIEISIPKKTDLDDSKFEKEGIVKFYNEEKRYGFIEDSATREDYFVHEDNLIDAIRERDKVIFELGSGPKGPIAINVKLFKEAKAEVVE